MPVHGVVVAERAAVGCGVTAMGGVELAAAVTAMGGVELAAAEAAMGSNGNEGGR